MSQILPLLSYLGEIPDPRRKQGKRYDLPKTLLMIILGTMGGSVGYRELHSYLSKNKAALCNLLAIKKVVVPSHVTIRDILQRIDYEAFRQAFEKWASSSAATLAGWQLCIDGKSLCSTVVNAQSSEQNFLSMVTVFCAEIDCILAVTRLENGKTSEQVSVVELLKALELKGFLLTLDALHDKKKTVAAIRDSENDYLIQVKGNEPKLFANMQAVALKNTAIDSHISTEKQKGRLETRAVKVWEATAEMKAMWQDLATYIQVINSGTRAGVPYYEEHYYITNRPTTIKAQVYGQNVRNHWRIENINHYQKDVFLREDSNNISNINAASCFAILNNFVVNVTGLFDFKSIKDCHNSLKNRVELSLEYLRT